MTDCANSRRKQKNHHLKYSTGDFVRLRQPQTKSGLKKKLRKDMWSEPREIIKVLNDQNVELANKKVVNVNIIKKKEPARGRLDPQIQ